jgi:hypothetical protein
MATAVKTENREALDTLLELWRGDHEVAGYAHPNLAIAIARLSRPENWLDLMKTIYPSWPDGVHIDNEPIIIEGYRLFDAERRARQLADRLPKA